VSHRLNEYFSSWTPLKRLAVSFSDEPTTCRLFRLSFLVINDRSGFTFVRFLGLRHSLHSSVAQHFRELFGNERTGETLNFDVFSDK